MIQIYLPLADNEKQRFARSEFEAVERELVAKFAGFTAYPRAPATGLWESSQSGTQRDDLVVYEVLADTLEVEWIGGASIARS